MLFFVSFDLFVKLPALLYFAFFSIEFHRVLFHVYFLCNVNIWELFACDAKDFWMEKLNAKSGNDFLFDYVYFIAIFR